MPQAGFCSVCGSNVYLLTDGSCMNGHPADCVSGIYEAKPQTQRHCAVCGHAYEASFDACPRCARQNAEPPGSGWPALGFTLLALGMNAAISVTISAAGGGDTSLWLSGLVFAAVVASAVAVDVVLIGRPEITGSAFLWWVGVVLLLVVFLPVYVYRRPKYLWRARVEKPLTREEVVDPTNPFAQQ